MNNNTRPEQRADINGKIVTRHVKNDTAAKSPVVVPAPNMQASAQSSVARELIANASDTDFSSMGKEEAVETMTSVVNAIDKSNYWDGFTVLTKAMETTEHPVEVGEALASNRGAVKLRDAWLEDHDATLEDRLAYAAVEGEGGYEDYRSAFDALNRAYTSRIPVDEITNAVNDGNLTVQTKVPGGVQARAFSPTPAPEKVEDPYGDQLIAAGTSTDFSSMSKDETTAAVAAISNRIDSDNMWDVLETLTKGMSETSHAPDFVDACRTTGVHTKVRDAWLSMHGADLGHRDSYSKIEGENGYARYKEAYSAFGNEAAKRDKRSHAM